MQDVASVDAGQLPHSLRGGSLIHCPANGRPMCVRLTGQYKSVSRRVAPKALQATAKLVAPVLEYDCLQALEQHRGFEALDDQTRRCAITCNVSA